MVTQLFQILRIYSHDDLYQIGCIGLCKAAATDKGGCFSTYAYRLIWNEICDAQPSILRGIRALILMSKGYTSREIGEKMNASAKLVCAH